MQALYVDKGLEVTIHRFHLLPLQAAPVPRPTPAAGAVRNPMMTQKNASITQVLEDERCLALDPHFCVLLPALQTLKFTFQMSHESTFAWRSLGARPAAD